MSDRMIPVYTRLGRTDQERTITFPIQPEMTAGALLSRGFAIDGRDAVFTVAPSEEQDGAFVSVSGWAYPTLSKALHATQVSIIEWFEDLGLTPEFK